MQNLNPFNEEEFKRTFVSTDLYAKIDEHFDPIMDKCNGNIRIVFEK